MSPESPPRWRVMPALALGTLMATIDISAVNIALPTLSRAFALPLVAVEWVVLAYVLTITGLLLTFGRLADRMGRRRVYGMGLVVFVVGSLACAAAPSAALLIAARALQGLGAAMMTANSSALLISNFPPEERGKALGAFGAMVGVGLALGPALGGVLVGYLSWRWIFIVNVPLGILAMWQLVTRVPDDPPAVGPAALDLRAAALWCASLALLMLALSRGPAVGWSAPVVLAGLAGALVAFAGFAAVEARSRAPMLPLGLVLGPVGYAACLTLIGQALSIAVGIHLPLYLEDVRGFDAARSGRWLAVLPLTALFLAPVAGRWSDRAGTRALSGLGLLVAASGLVVLSALGTDPHGTHVIAGMMLIGTGLGLFSVPNASSMLSAASRERLGLASGLQATMRNLGIAGGAAVSAAILASRYGAYAGHGLASGKGVVDRQAFALATRDVYLAMAGLAVIGVTMVVLQPRLAPPAAATPTPGG